HRSVWNICQPGPHTARIRSHRAAAVLRQRRGALFHTCRHGAAAATLGLRGLRSRRDLDARPTYTQRRTLSSGALPLRAALVCDLWQVSSCVVRSCEWLVQLDHGCARHRYESRIPRLCDHILVGSSALWVLASCVAILCCWAALAGLHCRS